MLICDKLNCVTVVLKSRIFEASPGKCSRTTEQMRRTKKETLSSDSAAVFYELRMYSDAVTGAQETPQLHHLPVPEPYTMAYLSMAASAGRHNSKALLSVTFTARRSVGGSGTESQIKIAKNIYTYCIEKKVINKTMNNVERCKRGQKTSIKIHTETDCAQFVSISDGNRLEKMKNLF